MKYLIFLGHPVECSLQQLSTDVVSREKRYWVILEIAAWDGFITLITTQAQFLMQQFGIYLVFAKYKVVRTSRNLRLLFPTEMNVFRKAF